MQNKDTYAVAVRKPDHEIDVKVSKRKNSKTLDAIRKIPILRGVVSFVDSLYLGMSTLMYSASFFEDEDDEGTLASKKKEEELTAEEKKKRAAKEKKQENAMLGGTVVLSIVIALALFFALPYFLSGFFKKVISSQMLIAFIEGVIRLAIFLGYIAIISLTPDIKRTFMYHGSEHKCINCIEHGLPLTVENVRKSSKHHKRCGTWETLSVMLTLVVDVSRVWTISAVERLYMHMYHLQRCSVTLQTFVLRHRDVETTQCSSTDMSRFQRMCRTRFLLTTQNNCKLANNL